MSTPHSVREQTPQAAVVTDDSERAESSEGLSFIPEDQALAIASRLADRWSGVLERLGR